MFQHLKVVLFSAAVVSASFSQPGDLGYGAVAQMTAAVLQALVRLIRRASGHRSNRPDIRRLCGHQVQHV